MRKPPSRWPDRRHKLVWDNGLFVIASSEYIIHSMKRRCDRGYNAWPKLGCHLSAQTPACEPLTLSVAAARTSTHHPHRPPPSPPSPEQEPSQDTLPNTLFINHPPSIPPGTGIMNIYVYAASIPTPHKRKKVTGGMRVSDLEMKPPILALNPKMPPTPEKKETPRWKPINAMCVESRQHPRLPMDIQPSKTPWDPRAGHGDAY